jgi:hypothetical protein
MNGMERKKITIILVADNDDKIYKPNNNNNHKIGLYSHKVVYYDNVLSKKYFHNYMNGETEY